MIRDSGGVTVAAVQVNPARAGMIHQGQVPDENVQRGKPRASGDDPFSPA